MSKSELESQFSLLGVCTSDKVLDECVRICTENDCLEEEFVEIWMAYSISKLTGADPTLETVREMERKEFSKKDMTVVKKLSTNLKMTPKNSKLKVYNAEELHNTSINEEFNVYNCYASPSSQIKRPLAEQGNYDGSPDLNSSRHSTGKSPGRMFTPAGFSAAVSTPSRRYASRTDAGRTVFTLGDAASCTWRPADGSSFVPRITSEINMGPRFLYMYESFWDEDTQRNNRVEFIAEQIMLRYALSDAQPNAIPCQESLLTYGRVGCTGEEAFSVSTILLEGTAELSDGKSVPMNLSGVDKWALFPGQVVVVGGSNPSGSLLLADKIYSDARLPLPSSLPEFSEHDGPLHVVVASGPYTQMDTMNYQPLEDLIALVVKDQPHVLILIGPFIDESHPHVVSGLMAETYEDYFKKIIENIAKQLEGLHTQIVVVASARDIHHHPVYPTPPYSVWRTCPANFTFLSDPAMLSISGVVIAVGATDIIRHMASQELEHEWREVPNKLHRIAHHVLSQRCFYPLYPIAEEVNLDAGVFSQHGYLKVTPHILLLPSVLRNFAKVVDDCLVVNPEHLSKGAIGGTFARFEIKPPSKSMTPEDFVKLNINCQIIRI